MKKDESRLNVVYDCISKGINCPVTVKDICWLLGISHATVWIWVKNGKLPEPNKISERCSRWWLKDLVNCEVFSKLLS